jgi:hypothetical protein
MTETAISALEAENAELTWTNEYLCGLLTVTAQMVPQNQLRLLRSQLDALAAHAPDEGGEG